MDIELQTPFFFGVLCLGFVIRVMLGSLVPLLFYFIFIFGHKAYGILVPQPGIEPAPPE